jgi:hypothetical protein
MPSLSKKDRVSLCLFTFSDGRRCRTPRLSTHPHFCLYHSQKEAQSLATQKLSNLHSDTQRHHSLAFHSANPNRRLLAHPSNCNARPNSSSTPRPANPAAPPQASTLKNCHSEHSQEEPAFSSSPAPSPIPAQQLSSTPSSLPPQPSAVAHPFRSNALPPQVRRRFHRSTGAALPSPSAQQPPQTSPPTAQPSPSAPPPDPNREAHWLNHNPISRPRPDSKLL